MKDRLVTVRLNGKPIKIHKKCEFSFKQENMTARAVTSDTGRVYVDDDLHVNKDNAVYRRVYGKPGDEG